MSKKFIKSKKVITMGLTALMCLGSTASFWELPTHELDQLALNPFSVTVYAATLPQFSDQIPDWASSDISYLVDKGIIKGYEDNTFRANGSMTRLEFLTAVVRSLKTDSEIEAILKDYSVEDSGWSMYKGICNNINDTFKQAGLSGNDASTFWGTKYLVASDALGINVGIMTATMVGNEIGWNQPVTREEAALIMYNACTKVRGESLPETKGIHNIIPDYDNITIDKAKAVGYLVSNGLLAGVDDNFTFAPKQTLTRGQACCILARITDNSRRLSAPVVPEDKQEWINSRAERDITFHNPVTGKDETRDINDWDRLTESEYPNYNGTST